MADDVLTSPSTTRKALSMATIIPLDSKSRVRPIHPDIPDIKVPDGDLPSCRYHPVTCEPFTDDDLQHHKIQALQHQYSTPEAALNAQQEAVMELKQRLEESERKIREIDREMKMKEEMRQVERKVYQKQGKGNPSKV